MTPQKTHLSKPNSQIDTIFESLESAGFPRSLQNMLLPEWVTPEVLSDDAAASEIAVILAKRLGLRVSPLFAAKPQIEALRRRDVKYKRTITSHSKDLMAAKTIAVSAAEAVASACRLEFRPFPCNASALRSEVLFSPAGGKWLGLRNLLMACWSYGLPVIYLAGLGKGIAKMDGMVVYTADRPVIILSKTSSLWAWQLFILAHEIAHVVLGHISPGEILIDEELGEDSYALKDEDLDERNADMFAIELLNGRQDATYTVGNNKFNFRELANTAYEYGMANKVDPGHIVLNFANNTGQWDIGIAAAQELQGDNKSAPAVIDEAMWGGIYQQNLPLDTIEFLVRVTGSSHE
ncbi:MAG: ImmA/IrrE family metallo-endopeptidase [Leptolyngbyaceae cyanobacterium]